MYEERGTNVQAPTPAKFSTISEPDADKINPKARTKDKSEHSDSVDSQADGKVLELQPKALNGQSVHSVDQVCLNTDDSRSQTPISKRKDMKAASNQADSLHNNPDYSFQSKNMVRPINLQLINQKDDRYRSSDY